MSERMLLDRESSLDTLAGYAAEARRGEGRLVLISGEAGVGKTALLEGFEQRQRDARWLWGACDGLFTPRPLGPVFDLAGRLGDEVRAAVHSDASRGELFDAILRQLGTFTVLVIEDLHWADEATIDLVRYLGRRIQQTRTLLVCTYRDDGLSPQHPLRIALGQLTTMRTTRRVTLAPLSIPAVSRLAEGSGLDPRELFRLTNGNPFFVTEVLKSGLRTVPESARDAVLARVAGLGGEARETLEVAALMGTHLDARELAAVAGDEPVEDLVRSGLLGTATLGFRHEIARLAVEDSVPLYRRAGIHLRILTGLRAIGCADDARLAHHAEAAGHPDTIDHARRAGRAAAKLASHVEAAAQYERALRFAAGLDVESQAQLYQDYSVELDHLDRLAEAEVAAERALTLWRSTGDRLREGAMLRRLSRIRCYLCRGDEAMATAGAAISTLSPLGPSGELAWAYAVLASQRMFNGDKRTAIGLARRAQGIGRSIGALDAVSDALNTEGCSLSCLGDDGTGQMRQALDLALVGGHEVQVARAYANFCSIYVQERRFTEAEKYIVDGIAYCDERELTSFATYIRGMRANLLECTGQWEESAELSADLLAHAGPSPANRICAVRRLGLLNARRGRPQVWELLDEASELARTSDEAQHLIEIGLTRAEAYWLQGDADAARREAESLTGIVGRCDPWNRGLLALWLRRTGSNHTIAGRIAEPCGLALAGRAEEAAQALLNLDSPYEAALVLLDGGSESDLRRALDILGGLGSQPAARITRRRMRQLGLTGIPTGARSATRRHPFGLTVREREVLDLLHARRTNAEIARALTISVKTAGHHVSAILAKLGAPTRTAAVSEAVRLGLLGDDIR